MKGKKKQNKPRNPVIRGMANNPKRHAGKHGQKLSKFKGVAMSTQERTQTELSDEELALWHEAEEAVVNAFHSRDMMPNDAMNVMTHLLARMAVMLGCEKEELLDGVARTYDHTIESFSVSPEDFH